MYLEKGQLEDAFYYFTLTTTPPTHLFYLYDTLSIPNCDNKAPHNTRVSQLCTGDDSKLMKYHAQLLEFIQTISTRSKSDVINTAEIKLISLTNDDLLNEIIREKRVILLNELVLFFTKYKRFYYIGLVYAVYDCGAKALEQWKEIELGKQRDMEYPGLCCIAELLLNLDQPSLIMEHIEWLIKRNPTTALTLLTHSKSELNHDKVIEHLSVNEETQYLEHIVNVKQVNVQRHHTHLAQKYLATLSEHPDSGCSQATEVRTKLQKHLITSNNYNVSLILNKVEGTKFKKELAILYGKLKEHQKALSVLVYDLNDLASAEEYCRQWPSGHKELHFLLLSTYLNCTTDQRDILLARAVDLLNDAQSEFNYSDVYRVIPREWPLSMIESFVYRSVRDQANKYRMSRIKKGLFELQWARIKGDKSELTKRAVRLSEGTYCAFCYHTFSDPSCAVGPSGEVYHLHCYKQIK